MPIPWVRCKSDEERAAEITAESIKGFGEKLQVISQNDIRSKDRVDISLEEYLRLKGDLELTRRDLQHCRKMIVMMGIPADAISKIESGSIRVETADDFRDYRRHYRVTFAVDVSPYG